MCDILSKILDLYFWVDNYEIEHAFIQFFVYFQYLCVWNCMIEIQTQSG